MEYDHRAEIDAFLDTAWGWAILPFAHRLATPISYPEFDLDRDDE